MQHAMSLLLNTITAKDKVQDYIRSGTRSILTAL